MKIRNAILGIFALTLSLGMTASAWAATATSTLNVSMSLGVPSTATVSANALNWATRTCNDPDATGNATITVNATSGIPYNVTMDKGQYGTATQRYVKTAAGTKQLGYWFYKDSAMTQEWGGSDFGGNYTAGSSLAGTGTGANQAITVYGKVSSFYCPNVSTGTYTDAITVTVNY